MKEVLGFIEKKKQELAQTQFIKFLQDKSVDPRQRLAWIPAFAFFPMMFKDFNEIVIRKEPADSELQEILNQHTYEDAQHWVWFLQDMKLMGYDSPINYTDTLKFLWGEENIKLRQWAYKIFSICPPEEDILMKLVVVESIEAAGNCAFVEFSQIAKELQEITKHRYLYFGAFHLAKETGHLLVNMDSIEHFIEAIQLTAAQKEKAFTLVEKVFAYCAEAMDEMLRFAQKHTYDQPFITMDGIKQSGTSISVTKAEALHKCGMSAIRLT
ncbi:hypothetical protein NIES4101_27440 (plasmid) [Calothrix sp. NIES-4101]|nr:hypothetical protein NIES4101_27440 [Calothrix sp. NIES-4101]